MPPTLRRNEADGVLEVDLSTCRGFEFRDTLDKVRDIPGRRYDGDRKLWLLEEDPQVAERVLHGCQAIADAAVLGWIREARANATSELSTALPDDAELKVPWATSRASWQPVEIEIAGETQPFNGLLRHQRPAAALMAEGNVLLADDMGLGKTGTTISAIEEYRLRNTHPDDFMALPDGPRLVLCPNSAKGTWKREIRLWLGEDTTLQIIDASTLKARERQLSEAVAADPNAWVIANWEFARATKERQTRKLRNGNIKRFTVERLKVPLLGQIDWLAVVGDEAHRAKNRKAQVTRGLWRIHGVRNYALTGTPLMNSPDELWSILAWLWPDEYHEAGASHRAGAIPFHTFEAQYVDGYEGYHGKVVTGVKNPDALRFALTGRLIRRTKKQVLDLPPKTRYPDPLVLNPKQRKLYDEASDQMWLQVIADAESGNAQAKRLVKAAVSKDGITASLMYRIANGAARTVRQRQIMETPACLGGPDDSAVLDSMVDRVMDSRPHQWVTWCEFKPTVLCAVERLRAKGLTARAFTGDEITEHRTQLEEEFQRGEIDVMVGTIMAMYQSVTLTAGNFQYWCSRHWTPAINEQGEDRQHRIGQDTPVTIIIAQPEDTVAVDRVEPKNRLKERIVSTVIPKDDIEEATLV